MRFPRRLAAIAATTLITAPLLAGTPAEAATDSIQLTRWTTAAQLNTGTLSNAYLKGKYVYMSGGTTASWTSPWKSTGFAAKSLVPSWSASTPAGSWIVVEARVRSGNTVGSWDKVATWAMATSEVKRSSGPTQSDDLARLSTDTVIANAGKSFDAWQVRVTMHRTKASVTTPVLDSVNGVAANFTTRTPATSKTTATEGFRLKVPSSSQMVHRKHFTQYDGGGAAWCSPTSVSMVLRYAKVGPKPASYAFTKEAEGYVDHAARYSYDYAYQGTGNWAFATAYASRYGADAYVTRMKSLRDVEASIRQGVPVVISIAFARGGLNGSPLTLTPGHLLVVQGFTKYGNPIVNDPAAPTNAAVLRVYSRAQLERAWQKGSGGIAYVVKAR